MEGIISAEQLDGINTFGDLLNMESQAVTFLQVQVMWQISSSLSRGN